MWNLLTDAKASWIKTDADILSMIVSIIRCISDIYCVACVVPFFHYGVQFDLDAKQKVRIHGQFSIGSSSSPRLGSQFSRL